MARRLFYLGPPGTYGEQAALTYDPTAELTPVANNGAIVYAVAQGAEDEGVAPIENSLEGPVTETLDALLREESVFIRGELVLPIEHNLIASPGTRLEDISVVMSHPQALAQCRGFLERVLPRARLEAALSTAGAVEEALRTPGAAAIGAARAAQLFGGTILAAGVQDAEHNETRFIVLGRSDAEPTGDDKTSIALTTAHDRPGTLVDSLRQFSDRGINLTRVESRPSREALGIYVFFLDVQGHRGDAVIAEALEALGERANVRLLGSYPRYKADS